MQRRNKQRIKGDMVKKHNMAVDTKAIGFRIETMKPFSSHDFRVNQDP